MFQTKGVMAQAEAVALPFPDSFFHCILTSPPYWGMRDYEGSDQARAWGGEPDCEHVWFDHETVMQTGGASAKQQSNKGADGSGWKSRSRTCLKCGMWVGALGHEPHPDGYVRNIVEVFEELGRVTREDAVIWLNLADSSSAGGAVKAGSRTFIPHRVALGLQRRGWIVRQDAIWSKDNPMVESAKGWRWERHRIKLASANVDWRKEAAGREGLMDGPTHVAGGNTGTKGYRPKWQLCPGCDECTPTGGYIRRRGSWRHTTAHEYVFMVTKIMHYFCDQTLVLEAASHDSHGARLPDAGRKQADLGQNQGPTSMGIKTEWRNPRSVFQFPASGYSGGHYATFPEDLIAPLIRSSCPSHACPICGMAWAPVMDLDDELRPNLKQGYRAMCEHSGVAPVAGWVLDPFFGSGTTGLVARSVGVNFAGVDLSYGYLSEDARVRAFKQTPPGALDDLPLFGLE